MKSIRFLVGLLLSLVGLAIVIVAGIRKPPINLPRGEWKALIAPIHLAWMAGSAICALGLIFILKDTFSSKARIERTGDEETDLREEILNMLPGTKLSQQELNKIIAARYSQTGILSLTADQLREVRAFVERRLNGSNSV
jgi:hypothetical protein